MSEAPIISVNGTFWPLADIDARPVIMRDCAPSIAQLLSHVRGRDCIVQAGANVGLYPIALADHFQAVWTVEPEPTNYNCLVKNLKAQDALKRVNALYAAFGERQGGCQPLILEARNCGAHMVTFDKGETPVWTIDGLGLTACDCIWLDVEGSELFALRGAVDTIRRFSPTIAVEDKGLHRHFGLPDGALQAWIEGAGYQQVDKIGNDKVFRRTA